MGISGTQGVRATGVGAMLAVAAARASHTPRSDLQRAEHDKSECLDVTERRIVASLPRSRLPKDLAAAVRQMFPRLPPEEKTALAAAARSVAARIRSETRPLDAIKRKVVYRAAVYDGFGQVAICSWPSDHRWMVADVFANQLNLQLRARGVETASDGLADIELLVALVDTAAGE